MEGKHGINEGGSSIFHLHNLKDGNLSIYIGNMTQIFPYIATVRG